MLETLHFQVIIRTPVEVYRGYARARWDQHTWNIHPISLPSVAESQRKTLKTSSFHCSGILHWVNLITAAGLLSVGRCSMEDTLQVFKDSRGICGMTAFYLFISKENSSSPLHRPSIFQHWKDKWFGETYCFSTRRKSHLLFSPRCPAEAWSDGWPQLK